MTVALKRTIIYSSKHFDKLRIPKHARPRPPREKAIPPDQITKQPIIMNMATIPGRQAFMLQNVQSLLPQCTVINVCLNGHKLVPPELVHPKINIIRTGDGFEMADRGALGKFYALNQPESATGYYLTVDDDIIYPHNYAQQMIKTIKYHDHKAMVGVHGLILEINDLPGAEPVDYREHRRLFVFNKELDRDTPVHTIGTATCAFHTSLTKMTWEDISCFPYSIDEQLARYNQRNKIPMLVTHRTGDWLRHNAPAAHIEPMNRRADVKNARSRRYWEGRPWELYKVGGGVFDTAKVLAGDV